MLQAHLDVTQYLRLGTRELAQLSAAPLAHAVPVNASSTHLAARAGALGVILFFISSFN